MGAVVVVARGAHQGVGVAEDSQLRAHVIDLPLDFASAAFDVWGERLGAQISVAERHVGCESGQAPGAHRELVALAGDRGEIAGRIADQDAWKRQVLAREIELEEIDTQPFRDRYGPNSVQLPPAQAAE